MINIKKGVLTEIRNIMVVPPLNEGETLFSLPLINTISDHFYVSVILPETLMDLRRFFDVPLVFIPDNISIIKFIKIKGQYHYNKPDLIILFDYKYLWVLKRIFSPRFTLSVDGEAKTNIVFKTGFQPLNKKFEMIVELLGIKPKEIRFPINRKRKIVLGISLRDNAIRVEGVKEVHTPNDLEKISHLITTKGRMAEIGYVEGKTLILLLRGDDKFIPPEDVRVVRYTGNLETKTIERLISEFE